MRYTLCRNHVIDDTRLYAYFIGTCIFYSVILGTPLLYSQSGDAKRNWRFSLCGCVMSVTVNRKKRNVCWMKSLTVTQESAGKESDIMCTCVFVTDFWYLYNSVYRHYIRMKWDNPRQSQRLQQSVPDLSEAKCACAAIIIARGNFLCSVCMVLWLKERLYCARETLMYVFTRDITSRHN